MAIGPETRKRTYDLLIAYASKHPHLDRCLIDQVVDKIDQFDDFKKKFTSNRDIVMDLTGTTTQFLLWYLHCIELVSDNPSEFVANVFSFGAWLAQAKKNEP